MFWGHSFLGRESPKSQSFTGVSGLDGMKTPALDSSTRAMSFASQKPMERKLKLVSCRASKGQWYWTTLAVGWVQTSNLEKEAIIPSDSLTLSEWWSDVMYFECLACRFPFWMTSLKFWDIEHFELFAVLAWLCSIKHYTTDHREKEQACLLNSNILRWPHTITHSRKLTSGLPAVSIYLLSVLDPSGKTKPKKKPLKNKT